MPMQTTVIREKVDKTIEETRALQEKAKRLREVFRKIDIGDRVKIIWILDNPKFENQFAKEKMRGWLEGRESIIKYGKTTAEIPTYPVRKTSKKSKWKRQSNSKSKHTNCRCNDTSGSGNLYQQESDNRTCT